MARIIHYDKNDEYSRIFGSESDSKTIQKECIARNVKKLR